MALEFRLRAKGSNKSERKPIRTWNQQAGKHSQYRVFTASFASKKSTSQLPRRSMKMTPDRPGKWDWYAG